MFKINLLPKEVLERRKYEDFYPWVFILGFVALALVVAVWGLFWFQGKSKYGELQKLQEQAKQQSDLADELSVFQSREEELNDREEIAQLALSGRVNMGQVANDISLVLPDEVWLHSLVLNEDTGIEIVGNTPRTLSQSDDVAYKSVAKTLVRLSELADLYDVWLTTAGNATWNGWADASTSETDTVSVAVRVVEFTTSGKLVRPGTTPSGAASSSAGVSGTTGQASAAGSSAHDAVDAANAAESGGTQ